MSLEELVFRGNMLLEESHFWGNMLPEEICLWNKHVSRRLILDHIPSRGSYLCMRLEVIRKAYLSSVASERTSDAECSDLIFYQDFFYLEYDKN